MSKVFEFHFNPTPLPRSLLQQGPTRLDLEQGKVHRIPFFQKPKHQETIFDTFCFFPETRQENKLGVLYLLGEIKNVSPVTQGLLSEIAEVIKQEYYQYSYETPQDCFRAALEKADQYLLEVKKGSTGFLGNLAFTAVALLPDFSVSISKAGKAKIFLLTGKNIFDIGDNFNSADSPIKTFPDVIEGSLNPKDKIVVVTDQLFDVFYQQEIFHTLIEVKKPKQVKELFKQKKPALRKASGCCMIVLAKKELPKIFLRPSRPVPAARPQTPRFRRAAEKLFAQSPFLQKNFGRIVFSGVILVILLLLGWLIF